ncbi:unnamed protein product [Adineta steineri]|uniref:Uncharacterized protein n=1 Tax=Adineta steineri TaxID=433720 RepID=A0A815STQ1_9BILA|nr:unnamed protein product [Adineta steineri]
MHDIKAYIEAEDDFPQSFRYNVEIYNHKYNKYIRLNDDYVFQHQPFSSIDIMVDGQRAVSIPQHIELKVTWKQINNNCERETIRQSISHIVSDEDSNFGKDNEYQLNSVKETSDVNCPNIHSSVVTNGEENLVPLLSSGIVTNFDDLPEYFPEGSDLSDFDESSESSVQVPPSELNPLNIDVQVASAPVNCLSSSKRSSTELTNNTYQSMSDSGTTSHPGGKKVLTISSKYYHISEELFNKLMEIKFYFSENVNPDQRRYGKCDVFGKLDSEQPKASHRRLYTKGELNTTEIVSYPKLKLAIPFELHQNDWTITVYIITERSEITSMHYSHIEKKFLQNLNDRNAPLINPVEIKITHDDLLNGVHM